MLCNYYGIGMTVSSHIILTEQKHYYEYVIWAKNEKNI